MSFNEARDYVYRLLKFRMRSENEIIQRLKRKKFSDDIIKQTLEYFKRLGLLDDWKFSQIWIEERLKKPFGLYRIKKELKQKGVSTEIIEQVLAEKRGNYQEEAIIAKVLEDKVKKIKTPLSLKDKRRLYNWFIQRGFDAEKVSEVITSL
ncbi:MAG: recombination regulator RecX [Candidatus Omnitrophica bacterium]|nr:recombination regulator RecX [Candidatus Omnitrophota bacterium]